MKLVLLIVTLAGCIGVETNDFSTIVECPEQTFTCSPGQTMSIRFDDGGCIEAFACFFSDAG